MTLQAEEPVRRPLALIGKPTRCGIRILILNELVNSLGMCGDVVVDGLTRHDRAIAVDHEERFGADVLAENSRPQNVPEWRVLTERVPWLGRDTGPVQQLCSLARVSQIVAELP